VTTIHRLPVIAPYAWRGADLEDDPTWIERLDEREIDELDAALASVKSRGLVLPAIARQDFPLPTLALRLARCLSQIQHGRGFVVLRGLPVDHYSTADAEALFWGLGSHLGIGLRQNGTGDFLGRVYDRGTAYGTAGVRGHESNAYLPFHTDYSDVVGLMCVRKAKEGGASSIVSAVTVHNEILSRRPDLLPVLYRGFHYIKREVELSENPATEECIPIFGAVDGDVTCRYLRVRIETAAKRLGRPLDEMELQALDLFDALCIEPGIPLDMMLQPGDMQLCNDYRTLHSRTGYVDWPESDRARLMLRLWLRTEARPKFAPGFPASNGYARVGESGFDTAHRLGLVSLNDV